MFSTDLKQRYKFLTDYFEQGLNNKTRSIAQSILFYGQDFSAQYELASEIARLLNCNEFRTADCQCLNCKWIRERQHPAVMTISKLDNKPDDDKSSTVISLKQAQLVKNILLNTSDYHRVFIFCDAEIKKINNTETWIPLGLNKTNFQEETANSMLKIIEEPPRNTTFFFLARDKNDLLSTIISRSQSFFVPSSLTEYKDFEIVKNIFDDYFDFERSKAFELSQEVFNLTKEHGTETIFAQMQNYLSLLLLNNSDNALIRTKIISDITAIEEAQKMIKAHTNPQAAFDNMFLNITNKLH